MVVNDKKNAMLCVSSASTFKSMAYIHGKTGEEISSSTTMKALGYFFDEDMSQKMHLKTILSRLRARTWALLALKKYGYNEQELTKIYCTMMRPIVEYGSPAWGSLLTKEQSKDLERQQVQALKHIYGPQLSANCLRDTAGIQSLEERREEAALRFALKAKNNPRFSHWFILRAESSRGRRDGADYRKYEETICRTDRHRNSPRNYMTRLLNAFEAARK